MNRNPYEGMDERPLPEHYIARGDIYERLKTYLIRGNNVSVLGPEGIGKTSFLGFFTHPETLQWLAAEHKVLICRYTIPTALTDPEAIYECYASAVRIAAGNLREQNPTEYTKLTEEVEEARRIAGNNVVYFQQICNIFKGKGYCIYLFLDQFERFLNSNVVYESQNDILRELIEANLLRIVVATDYDFNLDTLPEEIRGSYLVQKLRESILIPPFTPEESSVYLESVSGRADFTPDEIAVIHKISGGIPALVRICACQAYELKCSMTYTSGALLRKTFLKAENLLEKWLSVLDTREEELLRFLADDSYEEDIHPVPEQYRDGCCTELAARGLIKSLADPGETENWLYDFNSLLLRDYCRRNRIRSYMQLETKRPLTSVEQKVTNALLLAGPSFTFANCRTIRPELTDGMLDDFSPRARGFLEKAVIFEDLFNKTFPDQEDVRVKMYYYGIAFEQLCNDYLHRFFSGCRGALNTNAIFGNGITRTSNTILLGSYRYCLQQNLSTVKQLSRTYLSGQDWGSVWDIIYQKLDRAIRLRNLTAHAQQANNVQRDPTPADFEEMMQICFGTAGTGGLLEDFKVFDRLRCALQANAATDLSGTQILMRCTEQRDNGGLRGNADGVLCPIKISPKNVATFQTENPNAAFSVGTRCWVELRRMQTQHDETFYSAVLLAVMPE